MDNENYIVHYGIPGQKWGVRRNLRKENRLKKRKLISKINKENKSFKKSMLTPGESNTSYAYQRRKSRTAAKLMMKNSKLSVSEALNMAGKQSRKEATALITGTFALSVAGLLISYGAAKKSL